MNVDARVILMMRRRFCFLFLNINLVEPLKNDEFCARGEHCSEAYMWYVDARRGVASAKVAFWRGSYTISYIPLMRRSNVCPDVAA